MDAVKRDNPAMDPLDEALARVGDRWSLAIVARLLEGPRRFDELLEQVTGIAPNTLTQRLRHLDREGVLVATPYSKRPPRFVYELTASGRELAGAVRLLTAWGSGRAGGEPLLHDACGTTLDARWYCRTCEQPVDPENDAKRYI